jgi:hypothetical protein
MPTVRLILLPVRRSKVNAFSSPPGEDYFNDDLDDFLVDDEPVPKPKSKPKAAAPKKAAPAAPRPAIKSSGSGSGGLGSIKTQADLAKEVRYCSLGRGKEGKS